MNSNKLTKENELTWNDSYGEVKSEIFSDWPEDRVSDEYACQKRRWNGGQKIVIIHGYYFVRFYYFFPVVWEFAPLPFLQMLPAPPE